MTPTVVFDTVVLLQAGGKPHGPAGSCLQQVMDEKLTLFMSTEGVAELVDVLGRASVRKRFPILTSEHIEVFLQGLRSKAQIVETMPVVFQFKRDPDDEHILNLAIATRVQFLVTRDKDLLDLMKEDNPQGTAFRQQCPGLTILDPVALLAALNPPSEGPTNSIES